MKLWSRVKENACRRWCPGYECRMPRKDAPGMFVAAAYRFSFATKTIVSEKRVEGLVNAYKEARWLALVADWLTPEWFGVGYSVRPLDKNCNT